MTLYRPRTVFCSWEKYSCSSELHEEVCIYEKHALIGYDYYLTSYSVNYPLSVCCVGKGCLIGLTEHPKLNAADCEAHITEYLKKNEIPDLTVKIYTSKGKFIDRLKNIAEKKDVPTAAEEKAFALLSSLSL